MFWECHSEHGNSSHWNPFNGCYPHAHLDQHSLKSQGPVWSSLLSISNLIPRLPLALLIFVFILFVLNNVYINSPATEVFFLLYFPFFHISLTNFHSSFKKHLSTISFPWDSSLTSLSQLKPFCTPISYHMCFCVFFFFKEQSQSYHFIHALGVN